MRLPLKLTIGQPVRQLAALPRVKMVGSMIHFAMKGKKNKKGERMREKKQPRPLGNYTVERHGGCGIKRHN